MSPCEQQSIKVKKCRADKMAPWVKVLGTKADDLNLFFRTQVVERRELTPTHHPLSPQVHQGVCVYVHTYPNRN